MSKIEMTDCQKMTRREACSLMSAGAAGMLLPISASAKDSATQSKEMVSRAIPSSGEKLPVIGLGTWRVFDVGPSEADRAPLAEVLRIFSKAGARVIDSSPMYGRSEEVIGDLTSKLELRHKFFLATKVWTRGREAGIQSMERSAARFRTKQIDLMQVHNLVDVSTHLATMREWKAQGRFRYIGVTHYEAGAFPEVEKVLRAEKLDFLQINYSIMEREADQRILPLAQDRGVAVIVNRPFGGGDLFSRVRSKPLPAIAGEIECGSWARYFLKWILGHQAVTCVIPATANPRHLEDNLQAGTGRLPEAKMRQRMVDFISGL